MSNLGTECSLEVQIPVASTMQICTDGICHKFMSLIGKETQVCEHCKFNFELAEFIDGDEYQKEEEHRRLVSQCKAHDCMDDVKPCEDYDCPKNLFYKSLKWDRRENTLSRIARNCEYGLVMIRGWYPEGNFPLEDIAEIYGLTRERIRQVEEIALYKMGRRIVRGYSECIPDVGLEHFEQFKEEFENNRTHKYQLSSESEKKKRADKKIIRKKRCELKSI